MAFGAAGFKIIHKVDEHFGIATASAFSGQQMIVHIAMIEVHDDTSFP
jgi:hypothetical protein